MPEYHAEPYLHLAALSHHSALITWGAFYFRTRSRGGWKLVDDHDLRYAHPPRRESIGARSAPYGPAQVNVFDLSGALAATASTDTTNFCWITGLRPDTRYRYEVLVKDERWGHDERWDWSREDTQGLVQQGGRYVNEFRTFPDPALPPSGPMTFMVLGDYGTGMRRSTPRKRQREVALAMQAAFDTHDVRLILTAGDNIYAGKRILGLPVLAANTGDEDDDWFFTFFQPYRYMINRVPVFPCIGNHDTAETEEHDDRDQLLDNMYLRERISADEVSGLSSIEPGLFYRFRFGRDIEFICLDTSKEGFFYGKRLFEYPKHWKWIEQTFAHNYGVRWRLPFCHHPPFCAGPQHHNTDRMDRLLPLLASGGVRAMFSGHEHNFQHSHVDGIDYFVTGAGSKVSKGQPDRFADARTASWSDYAHFLLVTIDGDTMTVRAIGELDGARMTDLPRWTPEHREISGPIVVRLPVASQVGIRREIGP
jgi:tartrate-resistant acid phosphatase type 5